MSSVGALRVVPGVRLDGHVLGPAVILLHVAGPAFCPEPSSQLVARYSTGQEPRLFSQKQGPLPLPASPSTSSSQIQELGSQVTSPQSPHLENGHSASRSILVRLSGVGQRCKGGTRPHRPLPHLPALPPSLPCSMLVAPPFSQCVTEKPTDHSSGLSDPL